MSKQLILSATLSVLAMAGFAFGLAPTTAQGGDAAVAPIAAKASAGIELPALSTLLPGLR